MEVGKISEFRNDKNTPFLLKKCLIFILMQTNLCFESSHRNQTIIFHYRSEDQRKPKASLKKINQMLK